MKTNSVSFNDVPEVLSQLLNEVAGLKKMIANIQIPTPTKRIPIEIEEASKLIRKSKKTIYTLTSKNLIPHYKRGKKLYFYEDELIDWIQKGRQMDYSQTIATLECNIKEGIRRKANPLPW